MNRSFKKRTGVKFLIASIVMLLGLTTMAPMSKADNLPVVIPDLPKRPASIRNPITFEQMHNFVGPDEKGKGLIIDLGDPKLQGKIYCGPYPFEAGDSDYDYMRFRAKSLLC